MDGVYWLSISRGGGGLKWGGQLVLPHFPGPRLSSRALQTERILCSPSPRLRPGLPAVVRGHGWRLRTPRGAPCWLNRLSAELAAKEACWRSGRQLRYRCNRHSVLGGVRTYPNGPGQLARGLLYGGRALRRGGGGLGRKPLRGCSTSLPSIRDCRSGPCIRPDLRDLAHAASAG